MRISNNHIIYYLSVSVVLHFTPLFWIYINSSIFLKMFVMMSCCSKKLKIALDYQEKEDACIFQLFSSHFILISGQACCSIFF